MALYAELLLGDVARYTTHSERIMRPSGQPIFCRASKVAFASSSAFGLASPMSSAAEMTSLRAMNAGSSPPAIIRASQ